MDYERFTTDGGSTFLRVLTNTSSLSEEQFQALNNVFKEARGIFERATRGWIIPAEQEDYLEGLISGLNFTPTFLPRQPKPAAAEEDSALFQMEREREERQRSRKIPNCYQLDFSERTFASPLL